MRTPTNLAVENLALFLTGDGLFAQVSAAIGAVSQRVVMDDVGSRALPEGLGGVAWLSVGLGATGSWFCA